MTVVRVLPNVTGLDKQFDYLVPPALVGAVEVGTIVRVELHGRRVGGWVVALDPPDVFAADELKEIAKVTGHGPSAAVIELAEWAAVRWAARRRHFLITASPERAVSRISSSRPSRMAVPSFWFT